MFIQNDMMCIRLDVLVTVIITVWCIKGIKEYIAKNYNRYK